MKLLWLSLLFALPCSAQFSTEPYYCENFRSLDSYPPGYDAPVTQYDTDRFLLTIGKTYGLIKDCSDTCYQLPPVYDSIYFQEEFSNKYNVLYYKFKNFGFYSVRQKKKVALLDLEGRQVFSGDWDKLDVKDSSYCQVFKGGLTGFYSTKGKVLIPVQYEGIERFDYYAPDLGQVHPYPTVQVSKGGLTGLYNFVAQKEIAPLQDASFIYSYEYDYSLRAYVKKYQDTFGYFIVNDGTLVDSNFVVKAKYPAISFPVEQIRIYQTFDSLSDENRCGYLHYDGKILTAPVYKRCSAHQQGLAIVTDLNNKTGIINPLGQYVVNPEYDSIDPKYGRDEKDHYGIISYEGEKDGKRLPIYVGK